MSIAAIIAQKFHENSHKEEINSDLKSMSIFSDPHIQFDVVSKQIIPKDKISIHNHLEKPLHNNK